MELIDLINSYAHHIYLAFTQKDVLQFLFYYMPFIILLELPFYLFIIIGGIHYAFKKNFNPPIRVPYYPYVTIVVTCYSEGKDVLKSIISLAEQIYDGKIEILAVIDGAGQNIETYQALTEVGPKINQYKNRTLRIIPKRKRGGRVSTINMGFKLAQGEIIMVLDGDASCDNNMLDSAIQNFIDPNVVGVTGTLRARNAGKNLATAMQALEYMLSIHATKTALDQFNVINNISGAFGLFRKQFLKTLTGMDSGTAEDLDMTVRIKSYFGRYPHLKIRYEPSAITLTDVPNTWIGFFQQRLRWDGDLFYIYVRKHWHIFRPRYLGWKNFIAMLWTGLVFQLILPYSIIIYLTILCLSYPIYVVITILSVVYLFYLVMSILMFTVYILFLSERRKYDLRFTPLLFLFPLYSFIMRVWAAIATTSEILIHSHQDTSMAPWWVLRKSKF